MVPLLLVGHIMNLVRSVAKPETYESELEKYIVKNNPQSNVDVDWLTKEFERRQAVKFTYPFFPNQ